MDHFLYTNVGGHEPNCDHAQVIEHDGQILIVLCDGLNGLPNGDQAAQIISDAALAALIEGKAPAESCITANSVNCSSIMWSFGVPVQRFVWSGSKTIIVNGQMWVTPISTIFQPVS